MTKLWPRWDDGWTNSTFCYVRYVNEWSIISEEFIKCVSCFVFILPRGINVLKAHLLLPSKVFLLHTIFFFYPMPKHANILRGDAIIVSMGSSKCTWFYRVMPGVDPVIWSINWIRWKKPSIWFEHLFLIPPLLFSSNIISHWVFFFKTVITWFLLCYVYLTVLLVIWKTGTHLHTQYRARDRKRHWA